VDTVRVRLFTLTRFLPELLEVLTDVINIPLFDDNELKVYAHNKLERLKIDLKKNEVLAYRYLTEAMYGSSHPYGRNVKPEDYIDITSEDLLSHHHAHIHPQRGMIFVAGSFGAKEIDLIHHTLGQWSSRHPNGLPSTVKPPVVRRPGLHEVDGPQSHQAAIRIGRDLFPADHPDYPGMFVLNTILGGFFGSRLMTEIRENMGLTYGIYSGLDSFAEDGCTYISTETATENVQKVIDGIHNEVTKLQNEPIPAEELQMARNYIMGHLMTQLDGAFSSLDFIKSMKVEGLENEHFTNLIEVIQHISPDELQMLAKKYLDLENWVTIIVR
jgi:predicted Zn-dependent peptidase